MTKSTPGMTERIRSLLAVCRLEARYLHRTDRRLFGSAITPSQIHLLPEDDELAERVGRRYPEVAR